LTVSGISSKRAADGIPIRAVALILAFGLCGCFGSDSSDNTAVPAPSPPAEAADQPVVAPPEIGLIPLPSVRQVQGQAPGGRMDPFGSLPTRRGLPSADADGESEAVDPGSGMVLTGVLTVGGQTRALVGFGEQSGEVCVGPAGRCSADSPFALPEGWSVLNIDVARGCIQLEQNGQPQDPLCIA